MSSWSGRCSSVTSRRLSPTKWRTGANSTQPLLLGLLPGYDDRLGAIIRKRKIGAAGETCVVLQWGAEDAEADATDPAQIDDSSMAETGGSKIDTFTLSRLNQPFSGGLVGEIGHHQSL